MSFCRSPQRLGINELVSANNRTKDTEPKTRIGGGLYKQYIHDRLQRAMPGTQALRYGVWDPLRENAWRYWSDYPRASVNVNRLSMQATDTNTALYKSPDPKYCQKRKRYTYRENANDSNGKQYEITDNKIITLLTNHIPKRVKTIPSKP